MVFIHHFNPFPAGQNAFAHNLVFEFRTGVSMFFVLSGFLITYRYKNEIDEKQFSWRVYLQNRFARIIPLYFILTSLTFLAISLIGTSSPSWLPKFLLNVSLLKGFFNDLKFSAIAQGWSLTVEETFYLLAPLILLINNRFLLFAIPFVALLTGIVLVTSLGTSEYYGFFEDTDFMLTYTFFGRATEFIIGMFLCYSLNGITTLFKSKSTYVGTILMILVMIIMAIVRGPVNKDEMPITEVVLQNIVFPVSVATLFFGLIKEKTFVNTLLSSKLFQLLGKSSYAFYLIHVGIFQLWLSQVISGNPIILFIVLNVLAIGFYYAVERPLFNLLRAKH